MQWEEVKNAGKLLFAPERGGTYEVFYARPMCLAIVAYCTQDVTCMPRLYERYSLAVSAEWNAKVDAETKTRLALARQPDYSGKGQHMALGPAGW